MANRREFLQLSTAALGLMSVSVKTLAGTIRSYKDLPFYKVIYDDRFEDCRSFAREAERLGAVTHAISEDITELWYEDLRGRLSEQPGVIAGLTTPSSAFLLELFSHDAFHHQVFRGEHTNSNEKITLHRFETPGYFTGHASTLTTDRKGWSMDLARLMSGYDNSLPTYPRESVNVPGHHRKSSADLVSWIIAPLRKV